MYEIYIFFFFFIITYLFPIFSKLLPFISIEFYLFHFIRVDNFIVSNNALNSIETVSEFTIGNTFYLRNRLRKIKNKLQILLF